MTGLLQAVKNSSSASMALDVVDRKTNEIEDALDIYDRFVDEQLYESEELPTEVDGYLQTIGIDYNDSIDAMMGLATEIAIESDELDNAFGHIINEKQRTHLTYQEMWGKINDLRTTYHRAKRSGIDNEEFYRKIMKDLPEKASPGKIIQDIERDNFEGGIGGLGLQH